MSDLISIVVPVFNGERYVSTCIDKLLSLDCQKEVIVVNDASTDNSLAEMNKFADKIKIVNFEVNKGVSEARNAGVRQATGKYVCFVDVDDDFSPNIFSSLAAKIGDCDLCICDYVERFENSNKCVASKYQLKDGVVSGTEATKMILCDQLPPAPWGKLIKRELLTGKDFDKDLAVGEDILFSLCLISKCKKVALMSAPLYVYQQNDSSVMHNLSNQLLQFEQVTKHIPADVLDFISKNFACETEFFETQMLTRGIHSISMAANKKNKKQATAMLKTYCTKQNLDRILKNEFTPKFVKIECWIIKHFGIGFHLFLMPIYKFLRNKKRKQKDLT